MKTVWFYDHDKVITRMDDRSKEYVLASEAEAEIEDTRNRSCCKYPDYCDGECTCKICAPDIHIEQLESKLAAASERERVLHKVLRSALKSMENMCSYPEDHKLAIELIHAALAQKGGE